MRAMLLATIGLVACSGLAGCDNPSPPPAPTVQAVPPCNCQTVSAPAAEPAMKRLSYRHRHTASYSQREYDESETYSAYSSQSRSYTQGETQYSAESGAGQSVWLDGYGRRHYGAAAFASVVPDSRERRDPWHGYDEDCVGKK